MPLVGHLPVALLTALSVTREPVVGCRFRGSEEPLPLRGQLADRVAPKSRSTESIYHEMPLNKAAVIISFSPTAHWLFTAYSQVICLHLK